MPPKLRSKLQSGEEEAAWIQDGAGGSEGRAHGTPRRSDVALRLGRFARSEAESSPIPPSCGLPVPVPAAAGVGTGPESYAMALQRGTAAEGAAHGAHIPGPHASVTTATMAGTVSNPQPPDAEGRKSEPTLKDVLCAIKDLSTKMGSVQQEVSLLRTDFHKISERTAEVERRVSTVEDRMVTVARMATKSTREIDALWLKTDDLENRLRRNNIRFVGFPEKVEGADPTSFIENWLLQKFGKDSLSALFAIERAHRVPTRPLPPGRPPRPILARILHYRDRDTLLRKARDCTDLTYNGSKISLFPDFSTEVQRQRAKFTDVKRRLRSLQLPYAMLYPARLRVAAEGTTHFFEDVDDAVRWLDYNENSLRGVVAPA